MADREVLVGVLLEESSLTLEQFCSVCAVDPEWVAGHVLQGHLAAGQAGQQAADAAPARWRFGSREVWRARQIRRVEVTFEAAPELAALVADLIEELEGLRTRLRRPG